jgi:hypothetical protein
MANREHNIGRLGSVEEYNNVQVRRNLILGTAWAATGTIILFGAYAFFGWIQFL